MEHSQTVGNLAKALATAQLQFKPVKRDSVNPFFKSKYADLASIIDATKEALSKNGLSVSQAAECNGKVGVVTILMHESGEWLSSKIELTPKADDAQSVGSAITYARRYSLGALLNVASEDDDDGNTASKPKSEAAAPTPAPAPQAARQPQVSNPDDPITQPQQKAIHAILTKMQIVSREEQLARMNEILKPEAPITTVAALTKGEASTLIDALGKELKL